MKGANTDSQTDAQTRARTLTNRRAPGQRDYLMPSVPIGSNADANEMCSDEIISLDWNKTISDPEIDSIPTNLKKLY